VVVCRPVIVVREEVLVISLLAPLAAAPKVDLAAEALAAVNTPSPVAVAPRLVRIADTEASSRTPAAAALIVVTLANLVYVASLTSLSQADTMRVPEVKVVSAI
jgi:hypothetical protein